MQQTAHHRAPHHTDHFAHPKRNVVSHLGIKHGMHVADFGAGSGHYALEIAEQLGASGHVYAIDIQKDLLKRLHNEAVRLKLNNVSILWGDLETPGGSKIADHTVDMVLLSNVLFQTHLKN